MYVKAIEGPIIYVHIRMFCCTSSVASPRAMILPAASLEPSCVCHLELLGRVLVLDNFAT